MSELDKPFTEAEIQQLGWDESNYDTWPVGTTFFCGMGIHIVHGIWGYTPQIDGTTPQQDEKYQLASHSNPIWISWPTRRLYETLKTKTPKSI